MKSIIVITATLLLGLIVQAMPTKTELDKVAPVVQELMKPEMVSLRSGKKGKADVAKAALELAGQAESEAAKYLLLTGAFDMAMRAEDYTLAMSTIDKLRGAVNDLSAEELSYLLKKSLRTVSSSKAPELRKLLEDTSREIAIRNRIGELKDKLAKTPSDQSLQFRIADLHAYLDDWPHALVEYAKCSDAKLSVVAKGEINKNMNLKDVADFWWNYASTKSEKASKVFRKHAVDLYKSVLSDLKGLTKIQVERRIDELSGIVLAEYKYDAGGTTKRGSKKYDSEVEYLESDGKTYIDTGIVPDSQTGCYVRYFPVKHGDSIVFGMRQDKGNTRYFLGYSAGGAYACWGDNGPRGRINSGECWYDVSINFLNNHKTIQKSDRKKETVVEITTKLPKMTYPFWIFAPNVMGAVPSYIGTFRVSSVRISQGKKIIAEFVPVRVGKTGYMYDKVSRKMYPAKGEGELVVGPDKK